MKTYKRKSKKNPKFELLNEEDDDKQSYFEPEYISTYETDSKYYEVEEVSKYKLGKGVIDPEWKQDAVFRLHSHREYLQLKQKYPEMDKKLFAEANDYNYRSLRRWFQDDNLLKDKEKIKADKKKKMSKGKHSVAGIAKGPRRSNLSKRETLLQWDDWKKKNPEGTHQEFVKSGVIANLLLSTFQNWVAIKP